MSSLTIDKQTNKIAVCSAIFAGFAYVGYSMARNALSGGGFTARRLSAIGERDEDCEKERVYLRRLSQTTQTDAILGQLEKSNEGGGRIIIRPMSVQQRIKELNVKAHQFADALLAVQHGTCTRIRATRSLQPSPWGSPRVLSPVDFALLSGKAAEDLESPKHRRLSRKLDFGSSERLKPVEEDSDSSDSPTVTEDAFISGRVLTKEEAKNLVKLLRIREKEVLIKVLTTISNNCAFTSNQNTFREVGCLQRLESFLLDADVDIQIAAVIAVGNLALNEENQKEMKSITSILADLLRRQPEDRLTCSLLSTLTNIATLPHRHREIVPCVSHLYRLVELDRVDVKVNALRLLVNLSCNDAVVPYLLAAEAPKRLIHYLDLTTPESVLLRLTSLLANLATSVIRLKITYADLPVEVKAPAPDTMLTALFGIAFQERMQVKALALSEAHDSGDIRYQASRLASGLSD